MARLSATNTSAAHATGADRASSFHSNGHPPAPADAVTAAATTTVTGNDSENEFDFDETPNYESRAKTLPYDPSLLPNGSRSLSSISLQAFFLGLTCAASLMSVAYLATNGIAWWRLPAFFGCLSVFHFLEFWTTARFNLPAVRASSFLLFSNGTAYNVAHALATLEIIVSNLFPKYQSFATTAVTIVVGLGLVLVGQTVRSVAMAQAGTNFNHTPQKVRKEGHELVTTGIYGLLRHPSYFGFYWWALGTQLLVGNKICLVGYALVLWRFFSKRIVAEEKTLVEFFGAEYVRFRERTRTGIPFVR